MGRLLLVILIFAAFVNSLIALIKARKAEKTASDLQGRYISALERNVTESPARQRLSQPVVED